MYEIAFAHYSGSKAFSLYTLRPRFKLPIDQPISSVKLEPRTALILEEDDEALDPLTYLSTGSEVMCKECMTLLQSVIIIIVRLVVT